MITSSGCVCPNFFCPCCTIIQLLIKKFEAALLRIDGTQWAWHLRPAGDCQHPGRLHPPPGLWPAGQGPGPCPQEGMSNGHLSLMRSEPPEGHRSPCYWIALGVKSPFSVDFESLGSAYIRCSEVLYEVFIQTQTGKACPAPGSLWEAGFLGSWRTPPRLNWTKDEPQEVGIQSVRKWNDKTPGLLHRRSQLGAHRESFTLLGILWKCDSEPLFF